MSKPIKRDFGDRTIPNWVTGPGGESFSDITYEVADGIAKITINCTAKNYWENPENTGEESLKSN